MKKICCLCIVLALIICIFCSCGESNQAGDDYSQPSNSNRKLSLDERKELAEEAFITEYIESMNGLHAGKFTNVYWNNTRYSATVKQVSETEYEITAKVALYDEYENLLCIGENVQGTVLMKSDGTIMDAHYSLNGDYNLVD